MDWARCLHRSVDHNVRSAPAKPIESPVTLAAAKRIATDEAVQEVFGLMSVGTRLL